MLDGRDHVALVASSPAGDVNTRFRIWHGDALLTDSPYNPGTEDGFVTPPPVWTPRSPHLCSR